MVVGSLAALYGVIGLGQAAQNAVNVVWAIPRNSRLNPVVSRLRGLAWMVLAGVALLGVAVLTSLGGNLDVFGTELGGGLQWIAVALTVVLTTAVLGVMMRLSTPQEESLREVLPGAVTIAVAWQAAAAARRASTSST